MWEGSRSKDGKGHRHQSVCDFGFPIRFAWLLAYSGTVVYNEEQGRRTVGLAGIVQSMAL